MFIPDPSFYLKDIKSNDKTLIYMQVKYSYSGKHRLMISTGDKIVSNDWNFEKKRAIVTKKNPQLSEINLWLDKMAATFKSVFRNCVIDGKVPTPNLIKEKMELALNINQPTIIEPITFYSFFEKFMIECKGIKAIDTVRSYLTTFNQIKKYGIFCGKKFDFKDIDLEWRVGFIQFLQSNNVGINSCGKHIKIVKVILNEATERGLNINVAYKGKSFSKPSEEVQTTFLTSDELMKISALDLKNDKLKDIVKDFFLISAFTGLRFGDLKRLLPEHIINNTIQIRTIKTSQDVIIPISKTVKLILEKYNYKLPSIPCNAVFNRYLKLIAEAAKIDEPITITKTIAGIKKTITLKKWECISSHSGRRSFASNCILNNISTSMIMLMTGHKSLKVFQGYVRINQHQNAEALSNHDFFKN